MYPFITNQALYWSIVPYALYFTIKIHLHLIALLSHRLSTISHVEFFHWYIHFLSHRSSPIFTFRRLQWSCLWLQQWVDSISVRHVETPLALNCQHCDHQCGAHLFGVTLPSTAVVVGCSGSSCLHGNRNNNPKIGNSDTTLNYIGK